MIGRARAWIAAALGACAALLLAGSAQADPPVWIVKSPTAEVVLFGAVHVLPAGLAWEPAALRQAIGQADEIWFELPVDQATEDETTRLATQLGVLAPDQSLFHMLPTPESEQLARLAQSYNVSPVLLDRLKPWMAEIALAGAAYRRAGADSGEGVEQTVAAQAPPQALRRAFETPSEQLQIFDETPTRDQIASLRETMDELETKPDEYRTLIRAWMAGDVAGLEHEALDPLQKASPDLFRRVVTERNDRWTRALDARLKGKGEALIVVGVGHLVGSGGVPARLRALGYSVEGP